MRLGTVRAGRTIAAIAAAAAAAAAAIGLAVPAMAAAAAAASHAARGVEAGTASAVPWGKVGPGWALAMYSASVGGQGIKPKAGPSVLYLVSPQGGRYKLVTWPARSPQTQWSLLDWSGDVRRALFASGPGFGSTGREHIYQLQLRTGQITGFTLPARVTAVGYTRPNGLNVLAAKGTPGSTSSKITLQRYSLTGTLQKNLATIQGLSDLASGGVLPGVAYQSRGAVIAAGVPDGLVLISNAGGVIRKLPVPGVTAGCSAVRWWSPGTVLASCAVPNGPGPRMWLVPASGASPTALTPPRSGGSFDFGDFNAWKLSSGLYVDGLGACGTRVIGRQPAQGQEQVVTVPDSASSLVVNATRSSLMVERINGCALGTSLVWFNPATRAMKIAIPVARNQHGVTSVVPYFIAGKF